MRNRIQSLIAPFCSRAMDGIGIHLINARREIPPSIDEHTLIVPETRERLSRSCYHGICSSLALRQSLMAPLIEEYDRHIQQMEMQLKFYQRQMTDVKASLEPGTVLDLYSSSLLSKGRETQSCNAGLRVSAQEADRVGELQGRCASLEEEKFEALSRLRSTIQLAEEASLQREQVTLQINTQHEPSAGAVLYVSKIIFTLGSAEGEKESRRTGEDILECQYS
ncbi:hypothetical protein QQF64_001444 [Cirrhinus molitorella]|uniref:Uncharacterized protein n=1 Tax=Cirrhinus molitorella TaxID=172907 RepID=A0ABR3P0B6_9TELE